MNDEDVQPLGPDAFHAGAKPESAGVDGEVERICDQDAWQEGFIFGARKGRDQSDRPDGKHE